MFAAVNIVLIHHFSAQKLSTRVSFAYYVCVCVCDTHDYEGEREDNIECIEGQMARPYRSIINEVIV